MDNRFCASCGAPFGPAQRYCAKCGHAANEVPEQASATAPGLIEPEHGPPSEPVLGIIPNLQMRKGILSYEAYNLVVTPKRLIFAAMTTDMLLQAAKEATEESKARGKGFLGQAFATMTSGMTYYRRLEGMAPDQIMASHQKNWQLEINTIRSIRIKDGNAGDSKSHDEMLIDTIGGRYVFQPRGVDTRSARQLLRRLVSDVR